MRAAISAGYGKGFSTIIDANVVTAITALVLFALASAGVRGFALMLLIGTAMSLVTAVFATRAMLGLLAGFSWFNSPRFMGAQGNQVSSWIQHDYIGKRRIWFAISGAVVLSRAGVARREGAEPRDRLRGRHEDHVRDAAGQGRPGGARPGRADRRRRRADPGNGAEVSTAASASSSCGPSRCLPPS